MKLNSLILRLKYDVWQSYTIHVEISDYELYQNIIKSFQEVLLIYWWLTPTIAVFQLYRGVQIRSRKQVMYIHIRNILFSYEWISLKQS